MLDSHSDVACLADAAVGDDGGNDDVGVTDIVPGIPTSGGKAYISSFI